MSSTDGAANRQVTFKQVIKNKQYFAIWLALSVSNFGDWLALLGLFSLAAYKMHGTPYQVSGVMIAFIIPMAFLGPVAGVFVDRWNIKRTMISSDLARAVITAALVFAAALPQLYALVFLLSVFSCFFMPAQTVAIQTAVAREELLVANSLNTQTMQVNRVISPAVAGLLVAWFGEKACFLIDSASFVASASLLSMLTLHREPVESGRGARAVYEQFSEGLSFVRRHKAILFLMVSMVATIFTIGAFDSLIVVYVRDVLRSGSRVFGAMMSVVGIGTIIGAMIIGKRGQRHNKVYMIAFGILGLGVSVFLIALSGTAPLTLTIGLGFGLAVAYVLVPAQALMQEETPREILGRVSSSGMSLMTVSQLVSFLLAGVVASVIGIRNLYYGVGVALVAIGVTGYWYAKANQIAQTHPVVAVETMNDGSWTEQPIVAGEQQPDSNGPSMAEA